MDDFIVLVENSRFEIHPCFFDNRRLTDCKKLFKYLFQEPWRNTETIAALGGYLPAKVAESKDAWGKAGVDYINGYVDTKYRYELKCREKQAIERNNKRLLAAVKRAKTKHKKYQKILTAFEATKNKTPNIPNQI